MDSKLEILDFDDDFSVLSTYGEDLTNREYVTNPAIGRDNEIKEVILTLLTPEKSALLVGKPGIGKTAIVEGIAYKIKLGEVPDAIKNYKVIKINISSLLGNVESGGITENKLQILIKELSKKEKIILFIDEAHLLVSRNTSNYNVDFANMLKPVLDRGSIKMIGATTTNEYDTYILKDRAFLRRFIKIDVNEPSKEDTVKILLGTYHKFEVQSNVKFPYTDFQKEKIFKFIVEFTDEYKRIYEIGNRYPDIALMIVGNIFSSAVFENKKEIDIKDIYSAIKNCKNVYDDAKKKGIEEFKNTFKDIILEENALLD